MSLKEWKNKELFTLLSGKWGFGKNIVTESDDKEITHMCALKVTHKESGQVGHPYKHTLTESGDISHYSVEFNDVLVENIAVEDLDIMVQAEHMHAKKDEKPHAEDKPVVSEEELEEMHCPSGKKDDEMNEDPNRPDAALKKQLEDAGIDTTGMSKKDIDKKAAMLRLGNPEKYTALGEELSRKEFIVNADRIANAMQGAGATGDRGGQYQIRQYITGVLRNPDNPPSMPGKYANKSGFNQDVADTILNFFRERGGKPNEESIDALAHEIAKGIRSRNRTDLEEGAKPDFLDLDGDGDKEEPMKKAAKDKEAMDEEMTLDVDSEKNVPASEMDELDEMHCPSGKKDDEINEGMKDVHTEIENMLNDGKSVDEIVAALDVSKDDVDGVKQDMKAAKNEQLKESMRKRFARLIR